MRQWIAKIRRLPVWGIRQSVSLYQLAISPLLGDNCRYTPTCSSYLLQSVEKYGAVRGSWRGFKRICRCHPWHPGGHDPP